MSDRQTQHITHETGAGPGPAVAADDRSTPTTDKLNNLDTHGRGTRNDLIGRLQSHLQSIDSMQAQAQSHSTGPAARPGGPSFESQPSAHSLVAATVSALSPSPFQSFQSATAGAGGDGIDISDASRPSTAMLTRYADRFRHIPMTAPLAPSTSITSTGSGSLPRRTGTPASTRSNAGLPTTPTAGLMHRPLYHISSPDLTDSPRTTLHPPATPTPRTNNTNHDASSSVSYDVSTTLIGGQPSAGSQMSARDRKSNHGAGHDHRQSLSLRRVSTRAQAESDSVTKPLLGTIQNRPYLPPTHGLSGSAAMRAIRDSFLPAPGGSAAARRQPTEPATSSPLALDPNASYPPTSNSPAGAFVHRLPTMTTLCCTPVAPITDTGTGTRPTQRRWHWLIQRVFGGRRPHFPDDPSASSGGLRDSRTPSTARRILNQLSGAMSNLASPSHSRRPSEATSSHAAGTTPNLHPGGIPHPPGHRRSASTAAAAALSSLRESLRAAGIVARTIRRPARSAARQSFVAYKPPPLNQNPLLAWWMQLDALVRKHALVMMRGTPILLLLAVLGPALAVWLSAVAFRFLSETLSKAVFPSAAGLNGSRPFAVELPECPPAGCIVGLRCLMAEVASMAGIKVGKDVWGLTRLAQRQMRRLAPDPLAAVARLNGTWYTLGEGNGNPVGTYYDTQIPRDYALTKGTMLAFKKLLDVAIIRVRSGNKNVQVDFQGLVYAGAANGTVINNGMSLGPDDDGSAGARNPGLSNQLTTQRNQLVILSHYASNIVMGVLLAIGGFPAMLVLVNVLAQDKFEGMLGTLRQMNLFESAYWVSVLAMTLAVNGVAAGIALIPATSLIIRPST
ncbi:hypothetical protein BCR44DRAFT_1498285 [Catenaria anguillulae PL171]|uniref:Uncharacterized protein n=1 Tax=Catenaria anguillulae PL171 TaxID=765915 RepID=A0A1Y2HQP0_9FUNG|nr:hypothetical protein BCR44DRAFT_1498285 [Catenaria anguillulae PL171]